MKICIVSDSHDNRRLLEIAVKDAKQRGAEAVARWDPFKNNFGDEGQRM